MSSSMASVMFRGHFGEASPISTKYTLSRANTSHPVPESYTDSTVSLSTNLLGQEVS